MRNATPHDTLFHFTFQHPRHAAGWLRSVLPKELVAAIDWGSLRAAPEKVHGHALRLQVTDILFEVALLPHGHAAFVVPEHKSWLDPETHGITEEDLSRLSPVVVGGPASASAASAREAIANLRDIYCGSAGFDFDHVHNPEERRWLVSAVESRRFLLAMERSEKRALLRRLTLAIA